MKCCTGSGNADADNYQTDKPRGCTDLLCLVIFCFFWALLIFIAVFAFVVGSPLRFLHGADSFGNVCGHRNRIIDNVEFSGMDMREKPYIFYLDSKDLHNSLRICVSQCPNRTLYNVGDIYQFYLETNSHLCRYDYRWDIGKFADHEHTGYRRPPDNSVPHPDIYSNFPSRDTSRDDRYGYYDSSSTYKRPMRSMCPPSEVPASRSVFYRCIPEDAILTGTALGHTFYDWLNSKGPLKKTITDLMNSYKEMTIMCCVAISAAFFTAFTIHYVAAVASWIIMIFVSFALIALTSFLWYAYYDARLGIGRITIPEFYEDQDNEAIILWLAIIGTLVTIVLLLITLVLRTRVKLVVALFHESASCIRSMPLILIQPLWTFLALVIFFLFWLLILVCLATAEHANEIKQQMPAINEPSFSEPRVATFTLIDFDKSSFVQYMWWYAVIAFFWTSEFILACQQMVIAGAVSDWYFTRDRKNLEWPLARSVRRLLLYHLGSVALGSFLITLFKLPRLILTYLEKKLKTFDNTPARCCLQCCTCCLWLIEKFVKYLNHNAYTVVAIEGESFCQAAQIAFNAIVTNALRVAAINSIGDFILFLGKIGVVALTAFVGAMLTKHNVELHYWTIPVIVVGIFAYFIAHCILSVYEMVMDTIFLCFCEDFNRHDGSPGNEYFAPPSLLEFLTGEEVDTALKPLRSRYRADSV